MKIHTLAIGINDYRGTQNDLAGCVNDARDFHALFADTSHAMQRYPFFHNATSRELLLDSQATRAGITAALHRCLAKLTAGDLGIITFSGHGTYVPDTNGDEPDKRDEALVCADLQLIIDDEFRQLLTARHPKSHLLVITDSCHSGSVHRGLELRTRAKPSQFGRPRFLEPWQLPSAVRELAAQRARAIRPRQGREQASLPLVTHLGGCRDDQFSYDASFAGRPNGAFSFYLLAALPGLAAGADRGDWFDATSSAIRESPYDQQPVLNASAAERRLVLPGLGS